MSGSEGYERIPVAAIRRNTREELRVELTKMADAKWRLTARVWYASVDGEMMPGREGWTMPISALPELAVTIDAALREARDRALVE